MQDESGNVVPSVNHCMSQYWIPPWPEPVKTYRRASVKIGRNMLCPCGSGLKYKNCCWGKKKEKADGQS